MSVSTPRRHGRARKATTLVPLALLSAAFTASIAGANAPGTLASGAATDTLPDGSTVPATAIEVPASVTNGNGNGLGLGLDGTTATEVVATASTGGIPSAALSAYQRAETVINAADTSCNLSWQLIAAIGRVESDHGRYGGNVLDSDGVATPGIYGIPLNGSNNTAEIFDTDAGQFDNDAVYDRAVGPMQFIPSTWSVVGVDADGDGVRNPQDIDDAALGTAVYLCSGTDDLSTLAGQRASVFRYNHSESYVDLVLSIMNAYLAGNFTSVPNDVLAAGVLVANPITVTVGTPGEVIEPDEPESTPGTTGGGNEPAPQNPGGNDGPGDGDNDGNVLPEIPVPTLPPLPSTNVEPVDEALTLVQATAQCVADGISELDVSAFADCVEAYMEPAKKD
jgi:hypothetical protein